MVGAVGPGEFFDKMEDNSMVGVEGSNEADVLIGGGEMTDSRFIEEFRVGGIVRRGLDAVIGEIGTLYGGLCDDWSWSRLFWTDELCNGLFWTEYGEGAPGLLPLVTEGVATPLAYP